MQLNLFDLGVLIIIGLSALLSFYRGFVREVLSLGGWLLASLATLYLLEPATNYIKPQIKSEVIASGIAAIGLFFITLVLVSILSNVLLKVLKPSERVGRLDNLMGLTFGITRGALIVAIGFFVMSIILTEKNYPTVVKQAYTRPYVATLASWLKSLTPKYFDNLMGSKKGKEDKEVSPEESQKDESIKRLINELDRSRNATTKRISHVVNDENNGIEEKAGSLPSMEDLQRRIKEENERQ